MASTQRTRVLLWCKCMFILGILLEPFMAEGSGGSTNGQILLFDRSRAENLNIHDALQGWNESTTLLCDSKGIACDILNEFFGLITGLIHVDTQALDFISNYDLYVEPNDSHNVDKPSIKSCLYVESCKSRRVLLQDSNDQDEPDEPFDPFHPTGGLLPRPRFPQPSNLTGVIPRKDPLRSFQVYKGGFNVTNVHYWSSASYTGFWGYVLAIFSLLSSISYSIVFCWGCARTPNKERFGYHKGSFRVYPLICIIFFSLVAIAAAAAIYWANAKLEKQLKSTAGTLLGAADGVQFEINHALKMIQVAAMFPISRQGSSHQFLQACFTLGRVFNKLQKKVKHSKEKVYRIFDCVKLALTIVSAALSLVVVLGSVGTLGSRRKVIIGTFGLMTILLFATWFLAGVSFALNNVANDACMVMGEYNKNPTNSSIAKVLPCLSKPIAALALGGAKAAIKSLVTQANVAIDWANREEKKIAAQTNSSINFFLPRVCDPYGSPPFYNDNVCLKEETPFANFGKVYGPFRCKNDNLTYCFGQATPVPNFVYLQASMAMNASSIVYKMLPSIFRIVTCNFVKVTFDDILRNHCAPLRKSLNGLWGGFMIASLALMPLQVCFILLIQNKTLDISKGMILLRRLRCRDNQNGDITTPTESSRRPNTPLEEITLTTATNG
ncbi:unnamed protein product [Calypogeia fissa]